MPRPSPGRTVPRTPPPLLLWRHRHLIAALGVGAIVILALSVLRPDPPEGREVLVAARGVEAGEVIEAGDIERRSVPVEALPESGLAGEEVVGSRAAVRLEAGQVLTQAMTSAALAAGLAADERLVQVPVGVGAELAAPGSRVDLIGEVPAGTETGGEGLTDAGTGVGERAAAGSAGAGYASGTGVVCRGARVVLVQTEGNDDKWGTGSKVTLVTLAVSRQAASLVVGAATSSALSLVLSP